MATRLGDVARRCAACRATWKVNRTGVPGPPGKRVGRPRAGWGSRPPPSASPPLRCVWPTTRAHVGVAQLVEREVAILEAAGSNPVSHSSHALGSGRAGCGHRPAARAPARTSGDLADEAQQVERDPPTVEAAGSSPVIRSRQATCRRVAPPAPGRRGTSGRSVPRRPTPGLDSRAPSPPLSRGYGEAGCDVAGRSWGRGAAGSAPAWHAGGRGFEPRRLHRRRPIIGPDSRS